MVRVQAVERVTPTMTPAEFVRKWGPGTKADKLNERAGAQSHFIDLCSLLGVPSPTDDEDDGYRFEQGFQGVAGRQLYADVWKRGFFAWEYKRPGEDLRQALQQLMQYALPLENPPLLVVSDRRRIEIHTHFTGWPSISHEIRHEELLEPRVAAKLRQVFTNPEQFRPERSSRQLTTDLAARFAQVAGGLRDRGEDSFKVAHFLTQCVFCCFAEDAKLLKNNEFRHVVQRQQDPDRLRRRLAELFTQMRTGGDFGADEIAWFNGGLFAQVDVPALTLAEIQTLGEAAEADWRAIDPTILGTLFERGFDPSKSNLVGAHFTDPLMIEKLIDPVLRKPLLAEWTAVRDEISGLLSSRDYMNVRARGVPSKNPDLHPRYAALRSQASRAANKAQTLFAAFLERLKNYRALDPACGSGNFLYMALRALKDIELQANLDAERVGLERQLHFQTGPQNVLGIEKNEFAAELARATVWIGELQWMRDNGLTPDERPVLKPLNQIECRDALLGADGCEAPWPQSDVVIGNPPFVGDKKMRTELGDTYTDTLRTVFKGRVPGGADLVCYWFEKARARFNAGELEYAGLVATNSIRGGKNRVVLDRLVESAPIFEAWSDEPWVNEGAAVRVSIIAVGHSTTERRLNGLIVQRIDPSLSSGEASLHGSRVQSSSRVASFQGPVKVGQFDVPGHVARMWLRLPNPNGKSNAQVLRPLVNGLDLTRRPTDVWIVDFGMAMSETDASLFEAPFAHVREYVRPFRLKQRRQSRARWWWLHGETVPGLRRELARIDRYAVTPRVAKFRIWSWRSSISLPDSAVVAVTRADDATFGVLHSRFHELWSLRAGTSLEDRPRYTPTTCFEAYPFPYGMTPAATSSLQTIENNGIRIPAGLEPDVKERANAIAVAAARLLELREAWLNPVEWCLRVPEVVPLGMSRSPYPDRIVPIPGFEKEVAKRTLTNLYNLRPVWLVRAHEALDCAVAAAYGWQDYTPQMVDDEVLRRLLALNLERAETQPGKQQELPLLGLVAGHRAPAVKRQRSTGTKKVKRTA
ncbi:hypothetical protein FHT39_003512 [Mitsuaria sp. BK045]|uniref:class I SAM-dependent DNA methyltransferase n=1 Tax=unclassified Roseateles TaxID=2626991 RepID=UPI001614EDAE|nr:MULTISPECIES: class I SAM-dependent DNA methyltransferase [unclassified Roseateles]MBB3294832.1 hypothetical protein [Mitsuaria sp. BK041]MBB3364048.1 hypothetical protein [Mitsuaria sp. BK045]